MMSSYTIENPSLIQNVVFSLKSFGDVISIDTCTTCFFNFGKATRDQKNKKNNTEYYISIVNNLVLG